MLSRILVSLLLVCCGITNVAIAADAAGLQETFATDTLDAAWTQKTAAGGTIELRDGWATFNAPAGGRSHIERAVESDFLTVTGRIARWAAVYIVWDENNWAGVGKLSPTPFGRFYSIDVVDGQPHEFDHRGIDFNYPHRVRVRLGSDHVAFEYELGDKWIELRTIERPKQFAGAPKIVAAGKYYGAEDKPFAANAAAALLTKEKHSGAIEEVRVESTPESQRKLTDAQLLAIRNPQPEPVNALLTQSDEDPTYDKMVDFYPPFCSPREIVGVPAHRQEIGVDWLGRLDASPWAPPKAWFLIGEKNVPFGELNVPFKRRLHEGYLPLVTLSRAIDGVEHEMTVFGWSEGFDVEKETLAFVRFASQATSGDQLPRHITFAWGNNADQKRVIPLKTGDGGRAETFLRFKWPQPASAGEISKSEFDAKFTETASLWRQRLEPATRFDVPDKRVMEAYRAWIAYSMLNADTINGHLEPHDGAGFYDSMFGNSVSLQSIAVDQYGLHDYAEKILDMQMHFQRPDGLYVQDCGLVDAGGFLAGLAKHYELTGDRDWLRKVTPNIVNQCEWIIRERQASPKEGVLKGLIKFRPYNDYPQPVYNYQGNAWCAVGMKWCGEAMTSIGVPGAEKYIAEAEQYRSDLLDSMKAAAFQREGMTYLPMEPDTHRLLKMSKYKGGDYWGLMASPLLGTGLFDVDDERATWIMDLMEKRGGLVAGVCEFQDGIDHAYTFGYLDFALRRGQPRKALLGFWSFLAFGMTRDTYSPVEVSMIQTGENHYTLPHLYSCTEQLRLLRALLLREEGDVLWIGQGIPREWLTAGKHVAVTKAPTTFGDVSYRIDSAADGTATLQIDHPTRRPPKEIRIVLRHPQQRPIASVTPTTPVDATFAGETIVLRKPTGGTSNLKVNFQPAQSTGSK